ncbi:BatA and WFA domain-containing protein [Planctomycetota bacterium]
MLMLNNPVALIGLAALPLVYFLYLRTRSEPTRVSSVMIWKKVEGDAAGGREKKKTPDLRLLAYLIAICAGVLAIAHPVVRYPTASVRKTVMLIDCSASMGARLSGGRTRLDAAREEVLKDLSELGTDDLVVIVTSPPGGGFDPVPRDRARAIVSELEVTDRAGRIEDDIRLAASIQKSMDGATLRVYTDALPEHVEFLSSVGGYRILSVGGALVNAAISRVFVTRSGELYAWVGNFSGASRDVILKADLGEGGEVERRNTIEASGTVRVSLGTIPKSAGTITIRLLPDDALPADNAVVVSRTESPSVIRLYGRRDQHLEKALSVIPGVEVRNAWGDHPDKGPAVLSGTGCASLPDGNVVVINPWGRAGMIVAEGRKAVDRITVDAPDDPILASVPVEDMDVREVLVGRFPKELRSIVSADGIPVVATMSRPNGTLVYLGFDVSAGDWHTRPSFPIFWYNVFGRLAWRYRPDSLLDPGESDLRSTSGEISHGMEDGSQAVGQTEKDCSPFLLILMIGATAALWFSGRR